MSAIKNQMQWMFRLGLCLSLFVLTSGLRANPTGGNVAAGSAVIAGEGTGKVTINQASNLAIINWQKFSIASGESTSFLQPSASSAALNRVLGGQTSIINGTLTANGRIYLINGNGIVVGPGGVISASAFTASTRDISDADFLAGNLHFIGSNSAGVRNFGTITALGGDVVLIGKTVDNKGAINAPNGTAGLVAGDNVLLAQKNADGSTITVSPTITATSASGRVGVNNSGTIAAAAAELKAANGNIYALAVQNQGTIRATTVLKQGGHIWLTSDADTVSNSGTLDASATAAGGEGGTVTLKSATGTVSHTGKIIAQGGPGGAGGNAEISGAIVQFTGSVDLTAPGGALGNLLLDPATLDVITGGTGTIVGGVNDNTSTEISPATVVSALDTSNVTLQATTSITVTNAINASGNGSPGNLALDTPTLDLNAGITLQGASTLTGTATTVNVGANGLVQNAVNASSTTSAPTINLAAGATYGLTSEIVIGKSLDLEGNGAILDGSDGAGVGNGVTRIMEIDGTSLGITVDLDDLTLENGNGAATTDNGFGGALLIFASSGNQATVTITDSTLSDNSATDGGAIFSNAHSGGASLTITGSTLSGNSATTEGGGIYNDGESGGNATLTITDSTLSGNSVSFEGGGIQNDGTNSGSATITITGSTLSDNSAAYGGGIYTDGESGGDAAVTITDSTFSGNTAIGGTGGGINLDGGINGTSTVMITGSMISGNSSSVEGGGIYNYGESSGNGMVTITNSTLSDNSAPYGGGIYSDGESNGSVTVTITDSTLSGNMATSGSGGGINNDGGSSGSATVMITDSTLSGNSAASGGGIYNYGESSGNGTVTITNSTLSGNSATSGGGIYNNGSNSGSATLTIGDTILAGNTASGAESNYFSNAGTLTDDGYNLFGDDGVLTGNGTTDILFSGSISAVLAPLADNGGPTQTMALVQGSPAIEAGNPNQIGQPDQRGIIRGTPSDDTGTASDIGAYEAELIQVSANDAMTQYGTAPTLTYTVTSGPSGDLTGSLALITPETDAGTYPGDIGPGSLASTNSTYLLDFTAGTLTITKAPLTVAVNSGGTSQYGLTPTNPGIGVTGGTLYYGDTLSGLGVGDDFNLTSASNVGNYTINVTGYSGLTNYTVTPVSATYIITKALLTVAVNSGGTSQYGLTPTDPGIGVTSGTLYNGNTLSGLGVGDDFSLTAASNVGNYTINVTGSNGLTNYTVTPVSATYLITPATLSYVANPVTRNVGQPNPTFTGTVTGFVNGQDQSSATTGTLEFTSLATVTSPAGRYAIDGSGLTANFGNYVFVQAPGNLTALTIGGFPVGQPGQPFSNFSAQFNANANYNTFFLQSWFPLFDAELEPWLVPVSPPCNEPRLVYSSRIPGYAGSQTPGKVIAFGSSYTVYGREGRH
jgi:filamentous hemagglutinin family protein